MSETRVDRLEADMREIKEAVIRIEATLTATLPHLATKAELTTGLAELKAEIADKPGRLYMWGVMAALTGAYTAALAAIGVLLTYLPVHSAPAAHANLAPAGIVFAVGLQPTDQIHSDRPFDWDRYHARQDACREKDRIAAQCARGHRDELPLRQAHQAFGV